MNKYVALLRGINSGKNPMIRMNDLKQVFVNLKFKNVVTVVSSGNVIFESNVKNSVTLEPKIEKAFLNHFGFESSTILRSYDELNKLIATNKLMGIKESSDERFFISFLKSKNSIKFANNEGCRIINNTGKEIIYSLSLETKTTNFMRLLDNHFKKGVTTRSLTTVLKILKKMEVGM